jgi:hypothetical protein
MDDDQYAPLTAKELSDLRIVFNHGLKDMFIYGRLDYRSDLDGIDMVDSQEYDYIDNNWLIYMLFKKYDSVNHDFMTTFQRVALECVNQRFPDMGFYDDDDPLQYYNPSDE